MKKLISFCMAFLLVLTCVPMGGKAAEVPVQSFSFDCHNKTGYVGERIGGVGILEYSFEPYGASESVTMVSSDPTVATVEYSEGTDWWTISYHRLGTTIITATTASGLTDTCIVTVTEMEEVFLNQPFTVTVHPHDTLLFKWTAETEKWYSFYSEDGNGYLNINYRGSPYYGPGADTQKLSGDMILGVWNHSNEVQTYTIWGKESVPPEKFIVTPSKESAYPGDTISLGVTTYPVWSIPGSDYLPEEDYIWTEGPYGMEGKPVRIYSSSDESVAYFEDPSEDEITLANPGTTTITVTTKSGILTGQCTITVLDYEPIQCGESKTITLDYDEEIRYEFMPEVDGEYVFYMPREDMFEDNAFALSIYHEGISIGEFMNREGYKAVSCQMAKGNTYILCARNGDYLETEERTGTVALDILIPPEEIAITTTWPTVMVGSEFWLDLEAVKGNPWITKATWTVSDESVLTLLSTSNAQAHLTAHAPGTAIVTATLSNGVSAQYTVTVQDYEEIQVGDSKTITLNPHEAKYYTFTPQADGEYVFYMPKGEEAWNEEYGYSYNKNFYFSAYPDSEESRKDLYGVDISKALPAIGYCGVSCKLTAGTRYILCAYNYYDEKAAGTVTLDVLTLPEEISITQTSDAVVGGTFWLGLKSVKGSPFINGNTKWTVSDETVLALDHADTSLSALFVAKKIGTATVTATLENGVSASYEVVVHPAHRVSGENRFETAQFVANWMLGEMWAQHGVAQFDAVILANGYNFADALAGSYLSAMKQAPILLTWNGAEKYNYLNDATIEYVKANLKPGGTVYILGGTSAVPASIDSALSGFTIKRMDGANRFETNLMILEEAGIKDGSEILVCTSTNFADSLSASAAGKPILLVFNESGKLYGDQPEFLAGLKNCTFTVIGGESAVSQKLADAVGKYGTVTRLAGANRFETSVLVAEKYFPNANSAVLAYAWDFPDGLCGGGLAYTMDAPLILTMTKYETQAADYIQSQGIKSGVVLGGEKLISAASVDKIFGN